MKSPPTPLISPDQHPEIEKSAGTLPVGEKGFQMKNTSKSARIAPAAMTGNNHLGWDTNPAGFFFFWFWEVGFGCRPNFFNYFSLASTLGSAEILFISSVFFGLPDFCVPVAFFGVSGGTSATPNLFPQFPQTLASKGTSKRQFGQVFTSDFLSCVAPQYPHTFAVSGISFPQFWQFIVSLLSRNIFYSKPSNLSQTAARIEDHRSECVYRTQLGATFLLVIDLCAVVGIAVRTYHPSFNDFQNSIQTSPHGQSFSPSTMKTAEASYLPERPRTTY